MDNIYAFIDNSTQTENFAAITGEKPVWKTIKAHLQGSSQVYGSRLIVSEDSNRFDVPDVLCFLDNGKQILPDAWCMKKKEHGK